MISKLKTKIFEKYVNQNFLSKICLYYLFKDDIKPTIHDIISTFIENQIKYLYLLRQEQYKSAGVNQIDIEEILKKEQKYHILQYTRELINAKQVAPQIFNHISFETLTSIYEDYTYVEDYIKKIFNTYQTIISSNQQQDIKQYTDSLLTEILDTIEIFDTIDSINNTAREYESLIESLENPNNTSIYTVLKQFKDLVQNSYLSIVESVESKFKNDDKDVLDKHSLLTFGASLLHDTITDYIINQYDILPTGIKFIDDAINGFEAESVYIVAAPSNHGKTLALIQLEKALIKHNIDHFNENDVILHVTLEDNRVKLSRRIFTVFGNYPPQQIKNLYNLISKKSHYYKKNIHKYQSILQQFTEFTKYIFKYLEHDSITSLTQNKVYYMVQDQSDSSFTTTNLLNTLTILKLKNYNVRAIFLDYIDLMTSTKKFDKEYDEHGQIIKDLRVLAKEYHIPIITATQLRRETENPKVPLSNSTMGDSYKKVRFSDYILMLRQIYEYEANEFINAFNLTNHLTPEELSDVVANTLPVEYCFTKVKDANKNINAVKLNTNEEELSKKSNLAGRNLILFSKHNLSLYDSFESLKYDLKICNTKSRFLSHIIKIIYNFEKIKLPDNFFNEVSNNINAFKDLVLSIEVPDDTKSTSTSTSTTSLIHTTIPQQNQSSIF